MICPFCRRSCSGLADPGLCDACVMEKGLREMARKTIPEQTIIRCDRCKQEIDPESTRAQLNGTIATRTMDSVGNPGHTEITETDLDFCSACLHAFKRWLLFA